MYDPSFNPYLAEGNVAITDQDSLHINAVWPLSALNLKRLLHKGWDWYLCKSNCCYVRPHFIIATFGTVDQLKGNERLYSLSERQVNTLIWQLCEIVCWCCTLYLWCPKITYQASPWQGKMQSISVTLNFSLRMWALANVN